MATWRRTSPPPAAWWRRGARSASISSAYRRRSSAATAAGRSSRAAAPPRTTPVSERGALALDAPRLGALAAEAADREMVLLVGLSERREDGEIGNTVAIYAEGK